LSSAQKKILLFIKTLFAAGLIFFLMRSDRLDFLVITNATHFPNYLFLGILCCTFALVMPIFRWWVLSRVQQLSLGILDALRLTMIGTFFNLFIPGGSGGDVVRAAYAVRDCPERKAQALTIAFVDRGLGLHALLLSCVSVLFFEPNLLINNPGLNLWLLLVFGLLCITTVVPLLLIWERTNSVMISLCGKIIGGEEAWREAMKLYRKETGMISLAYLLSVGSVMFNVFAIHFMMQAVGSTPTVVESIAVVPMVIIANTLPFTPGGIGIAESVSAGLYGLVGQVGGANGMLLTRFFMILFSLCGLPFFLMNSRLKKISKDTS